MEKRKLVKRLEDLYNDCSEIERKKENAPFTSAYCYGKLKEGVRIILKEEGVWNENKK